MVVQKLSGNKKQHAPSTLKEHASQNIQFFDSIADITIYTDGSIDDDRAGAAFIINTNFEHPINATDMCFRLNNGLSTMQTEILAIKKGLEFCQNTLLPYCTNPAPCICIHTDSLSSIHTLTHNKHKDNIQLITSTQLIMQQLQDQQCTIYINYIPSHVGIMGNEEADMLAKLATALPTVHHTIPTSMNQYFNHYKHNIITRLANITKQKIDKHTSVKWHQQVTQNKYTKPPKIFDRQTEVAWYRLRMGYRCVWNLKETLLKECQHCSRPTCTPLLHYLLECCKTQPALGPALDADMPGSHEEAATRARNLLKNAKLFQLLTKAFALPR